MCIRDRNCSTCGTDVKIRNNGHVNITRVTTMGHEVAGEVVEVGADARGGFQVGDRVQCIAAVPCGECYECIKGWMEVCQNQTSVGYQYDGGFAEYMIVPEQVLNVDGLNPVSYTHLDVYKRQSVRWSSPAPAMPMTKVAGLPFQSMPFG